VVPSHLFIRSETFDSTVAAEALEMTGDYSSGYCSGFSPDSLLSGNKGSNSGTIICIKI